MHMGRSVFLKVVSPVSASTAVTLMISGPVVCVCACVRACMSVRVCVCIRLSTVVLIRIIFHSGYR